MILQSNMNDIHLQGQPTPTNPQEKISGRFEYVNMYRMENVTSFFNRTWCVSVCDVTKFLHILSGQLNVNQSHQRPGHALRVPGS
jgi:hypothetical protein